MERSAPAAAVLWPEDHAAYRPDKMGKATLYRSDRILVGLNGFEPGQTHALHAHENMDKVYHVVSGTGRLLLDDRTEPLAPGAVVVTPAGVAHGIHNDGAERLLVVAILAPAP